MKKLFLSLAVGSMVLSLILVNVVLADSTIGTNISTTGSLTVNSGSATAVQFQDGSATSVFIFNTSNKRLGIGAAPGTTFEAQGTASASYLLTANTIQVGGHSSAAYSRFGTSTTNHANYISTTNDLLISGDIEILGTASFGGTASVSGIFYMNDGRHRPNANSTTAFRFQNTAGTSSILTIDTTNARVGINTTPDTTLEVIGTASASYFFSANAAQFAGNASVAYSRFGTGATGHTLAASNDLLITGLLEVDSNAFFDSKASVSSNLQISGRFIADTAASHSFTGDLVVKGTTSGTASVSHNLNVGENSTATTSVTFETKASAKGACFTVTGSNGTTYYARITASGSDVDGMWVVNTTACN